MRSETAILDQLLRHAGRWRKRLAKACLSCWNRRHPRAALAPGTPVRLPIQSLKLDNDLYLLNLEVWSLRYGVTPEFVLDTLLDFAEKYPRLAGVRLLQDHRGLALAVPAAQLGGRKNRQLVEDAVKRDYPGGENWEALRSRPLIQLIPRTRLDPAKPDDWLRRYASKIESVRREQEERQNEIRNRKRPYRPIDAWWLALRAADDGTPPPGPSRPSPRTTIRKKKES